MCRQTQHRSANCCLASLLISNDKFMEQKIRDWQLWITSPHKPVVCGRTQWEGQETIALRYLCQLVLVMLWSSRHTSHTGHKDTHVYYSNQNLSESICFIYTVLTGREQNNGEFTFSLGSYPRGNSSVILSINSSRFVSSLDFSNFSFLVPDCMKSFSARLRSHLPLSK